MDWTKSCAHNDIEYTSAKDLSSSNFVLFLSDHVKNKRHGKSKLVIYKKGKTRFN